MITLHLSRLRVKRLIPTTPLGHAAPDHPDRLERLKALRRELVDPKATEHHGRVVKSTGDGMLVEFARPYSIGRVR